MTKAVLFRAGKRVISVVAWLVPAASNLMMIWFRSFWTTDLLRTYWPEQMQASNTKTVIVWSMLPMCFVRLLPSLRIKVVRDSDHPCSHSYKLISIGHFSTELQIIFSSKIAGLYSVYVSVCGFTLPGFPSLAFVPPGPLDAAKTFVTGLTSRTLVLTTEQTESIRINARDQFENAITDEQELLRLLPDFRIQLSRLSDQKPLNEERSVMCVSEGFICAMFMFTLSEAGWYASQVEFRQQQIGSPIMTIIVLVPSDRDHVDQYLKSLRDFTFEKALFKAYVVPQGSTFQKKGAKKVYVCLSNHQVCIMRYILGFVPSRMISFRISPATKIELVKYDCDAGVSVIRIQDSFQTSPELVVDNVDVMAAAFQKLLLNKIGGSETLADKQAFFNSCLCQAHPDRGGGYRSDRTLLIRRSNILQSCMQATRYWTTNDWCKLWKITFEGEGGIDGGGLGRELTELLCKQLFGPELGLFLPLEDNCDVVFPNAKCREPLQLYEFAGKFVGKCLYESAHGAGYAQLLPIRLAKAFLAHLVGLRVHYRHFASDAPDFYQSQVSLIERTNMDEAIGLEHLTFSVEEHVPQTTVKELKPGGAMIRVTEQNKMEYLDLLTQYRLSSTVKGQCHHFVKGLHAIVPDALLTMLDENELDWLMCGVREYSIDDLKSHCQVASFGLSSTTLEWFWLALEHFSPQQLVLLLQFVTGRSHLPHGGFASLRPAFQIVSSLTHATLPTAQTCFNMICLPSHNSYAQFEKALLTAITDGCQGFELA